MALTLTTNSDLQTSEVHTSMLHPKSMSSMQKSPSFKPNLPHTHLARPPRIKLPAEVLSVVALSKVAVGAETSRGSGKHPVARVRAGQQQMANHWVRVVKNLALGIAERVFSPVVEEGRQDRVEADAVVNLSLGEEELV